MFTDRTPTATGPTKARLESTKRALIHGAGWNRKPRARARDLEHPEQCIVVEWLELHRIPFFAVPNGGVRDWRTSTRLKDEGVQRGVPDLFVFLSNGLTVALEMKAPHGGVTSPEQKAWVEMFRERNGFFGYVAAGADAAIKMLEVANREGGALSVKWALVGGRVLNMKGTEMRKINLGDKVRDEITGFEGRVTGVATYISGCVQYSIAPPVDKDGKMSDANWIDEQRLVVVEKKEVIARRNTGGPQTGAPVVR